MKLMKLSHFLITCGLAAALAGCTGMGLGISLPIGGIGGVGVSIGSDGSVGGSVGIGQGGVGVSVGGRAQLPQSSPPASAPGSSAKR